MKRYMVIAPVLALASTAAFAADLPSRHVSPVAPAVVAPAFSYTGFYAGVNGGFGRGVGGGTSTSKSMPIVAPGQTSREGGRSAGSHSRSSGGFVGGAQIGYNYQTGPLVLGVEADMNYADMKLSRYENRFEATKRKRVAWFGTVRPRIGILATERMMLYGTGGLAFGQIKAGSSIIANDSSAIARTHARNARFSTGAGWTIGGGIEYALTDNLSLKGEYDYVSLRGKRSSTGIPRTASSGKSDAKFQVVRVGLNYKF